MGEIKIIERGWAGHFILSDRCLFRRNTLMIYQNKEIVISTIGLYQDKDDNILPIYSKKPRRYFETKVFWVDKRSKKLKDIDVEAQIYLNGKWYISKKRDMLLEANKMHEDAVEEMKLRIIGFI